MASIRKEICWPSVSEHVECIHAATIISETPDSQMDLRLIVGWVVSTSISS